jgi:hypothetical protein
MIAAAGIGCGEPASPTGAENVAKVFALVSIESNSLPLLVSNENDDRVILSSGRLILNSDATYSLELGITESIAGSAEFLSTDVVYGNYSKSSDQYSFTASADAQTFTGVLSGSGLTIKDGPQTALFR